MADRPDSAAAESRSYHVFLDLYLDALSPLLDGVRVSPVELRRLELSAPWGADMQSDDETVLYTVLSGSCVLEVDGRPEKLMLTKGDIVFVLPGRRHVMRDAPWTEARLSVTAVDRYLRGQPPVLTYGGGGERTTLLCSPISVSATVTSVPVWLLAPVIRCTVVPGDGLESVVTALRDECDRPTADRAAVTARLCEILFIRALRAHLRELSAEAPALRARSDRRIAHILQLVCAEPQRPWTLDLLAAEAGLSRSAFSERFSAQVSKPPMQFVTGVRMLRATQLLREGDLTISEVASRVGYREESAFSRAFQRATGMRPGAMRQQAVHELAL